jgi:hypothetical protein
MSLAGSARIPDMSEPGMFESYRTDPAVRPDPDTWETELAHLVAA